jgi:hypothetical protein
MPMYTIVNKKTEDTQTVMCSYDSLQEKLKELGTDWSQQISAPALISGTGNVINKTSGDWKNLMSKIEKGAGGSREGVNIKS